MFTREQIEAAHDMVKVGSDFPKYVKEIRALGVKSHEVVLTDGTWIFQGDKDFLLKYKSEPAGVSVSSQPSSDRFKQILTHHQQGKTDYPTFCIQAGEAGVERWISDFDSMTVTYLDRYGNVVAIEPIPGM